MKQLLILPFFCAGLLPANPKAIHNESTAAMSLCNNAEPSTIGLNLQDPGNSRMQAAVFKAQEYCRAELKNFEFDVQYSVVSAVVYFSGANFKGVEKGTIGSNSLRTIRGQMDRCIPGSVVIFDEVKVKGPDNLTRTIPGLSLVLY